MELKKHPLHEYGMIVSLSSHKEKKISTINKQSDEMFRGSDCFAQCVAPTRITETMESSDQDEFSLNEITNLECAINYCANQQCVGPTKSTFSIEASDEDLFVI